MTAYLRAIVCSPLVIKHTCQSLVIAAHIRLLYTNLRIVHYMTATPQTTMSPKHSTRGKILELCPAGHACLKSYLALVTL